MLDDTRLMGERLSTYMLVLFEDAGCDGADVGHGFKLYDFVPVTKLTPKIALRNVKFKIDCPRHAVGACSLLNLGQMWQRMYLGRCFKPRHMSHTASRKSTTRLQC